MKPDTEDSLLRSLAHTLTENAGATLQEMASAAGVSRATLYRFASTREQLLATLQQRVLQVMKRILDDAGLDSQPPLDALRQLIVGYMAEREFCAFMITQFEPFLKPDAQSPVLDQCFIHEQRMDDFFQRGQDAGIFRRDMPARWLTGLFFGFIHTLCESEYRGRIARADMKRLFEDMFLSSVLARRD